MWFDWRQIVKGAARIASWWVMGLIITVGSFLAGHAFSSFRSQGACFEACKKQFDEYKKESQNECICGGEQTCPFGPGIVGVQKCNTGSFMKNQWGRCEPDPKYR